MGDVNRFRQALRSLLTRISVDQEVERELEFHMEMRTRELIARGMDAREARAAAVARFGDLASVERRCRRIARGRNRDMERFVLFSELRQDLVFSARQLRRNPVLATVVVLTMAVAIAANTTVFSVSDAVLMQPLPFPRSERLIRIHEATPEGRRSSVSGPNFTDLRERNRSFVDLAAISTPILSFTLLGDGEPVQCSGIAATGSLFPVLGVEPLLGRTFVPEEEQPDGDSRVVILSHGLWQRRFGSDPGIVGRTVTLDGQAWTVVGVLPAGFRLMIAPDVWVPLALDPSASRDDRRLEAFGRLADGVSQAQAEADLAALAADLARQEPEAIEPGQGRDDPQLLGVARRAQS